MNGGILPKLPMPSVKGLQKKLGTIPERKAAMKEAMTAKRKTKESDIFHC